MLSFYILIMVLFAESYWFADVVINIADAPSKELLAHLQLLSSYFKPFQQYHLGLVQVSAYITCMIVIAVKSLHILTSHIYIVP